jgi:hypothetical protein
MRIRGSFSYFGVKYYIFADNYHNMQILLRNLKKTKSHIVLGICYWSIGGLYSVYPLGLFISHF